MYIYIYILYILIRTKKWFMTHRVLNKHDFADDNTFYSCGANLKTVLENLIHDATKLLYWFTVNFMKTNPEKFQFLILSKKPYQPQKLFVM